MLKGRSWRLSDRGCGSPTLQFRTNVRGVKYPELTSRQRMAAAKVSGAVKRLGFGEHAGWPIERKLAELYAITRDSVVFGHCLGDSLTDAEVEGSSYLQCADLLRAAGADEVAAQEKAEWRRRQIELRDSGDRML
jgi:hypothetical protein